MSSRGQLMASVFSGTGVALGFVVLAAMATPASAQDVAEAGAPGVADYVVPQAEDALSNVVDTAYAMQDCSNTAHTLNPDGTETCAPPALYTVDAVTTVGQPIEGGVEDPLDETQIREGYATEVVIRSYSGAQFSGRSDPAPRDRAATRAEQILQALQRALSRINFQLSANVNFTFTTTTVVVPGVGSSTSTSGSVSGSVNGTVKAKPKPS